VVSEAPVRGRPRAADERGDAPISGDPGAEPIMAETEPESPAATRIATAEVRDPYARWCRRGGVVRRPPIPIHDPKPRFGSVVTSKWDCASQIQ